MDRISWPNYPHLCVLVPLDNARGTHNGAGRQSRPPCSSPSLPPSLSLPLPPSPSLPLLPPPLLRRVLPSGGGWPGGGSGPGGAAHARPTGTVTGNLRVGLCGGATVAAPPAGAGDEAAPRRPGRAPANPRRRGGPAGGVTPFSQGVGEGERRRGAGPARPGVGGGTAVLPRRKLWGGGSWQSPPPAHVARGMPAPDCTTSSAAAVASARRARYACPHGSPARPHRRHHENITMVHVVSDASPSAAGERPGGARRGRGRPLPSRGGGRAGPAPLPPSLGGARG